jgi:hypothetical protein
VNILFVMKHRGNAGSTHAVANYMRIAPTYGHSVAIYGTPISYVPELKFSMDVKAFDRVVYLFESELYRVKRLQEVAVIAAFAREQRLIFDADGMYNPLITIDSYDFNHANEFERGRWIEHLNVLSDRIAQPTFSPLDPRVSTMTFFGYNPTLQMTPENAPPKQCDIMHIGHNWWRWREVANDLLPAFEKIRDQVGEIAFVGLWWDAPPPEGRAAGPETAFESDPERFQRLRIQTPKAVMYHDVIRTMSTARINIMTQRPVLRHLKCLTLKYFEIFCADTIPLLMLDSDHAESVYGPAALELTLPGRVAERILDALQRPDHYRSVVEDVRKHLVAHYSYEKLTGELIGALQNGASNVARGMRA